MSIKKHEVLFLVTVFLMPLNLGKHFVYIDSFVGGILVDYLIPTLYLTDLLVCATLALWMLSGDLKKSFSLHTSSKNFIRLLLLLNFAALISYLAFPNTVVSLPALLRWIVYSLFAVYALNFSHHTKLFTVLFVSTFLVSILSLIQYYLQGSVFDNYLFFGEQPYSASTRGIVLENISGVVKVPAYGTFKHPNVLGGYLSIILLWMYHLQRKKLVPPSYIRWLYLMFFICLGALFVSFSQSALLVFMFGFALHLLYDFWPRFIKVLGMVFTLTVVLAGMTLPLWIFHTNFVGSSIERRVGLMESSYALISKHLLYGTGINTNTVYIEDNMPLSRDLRFVQPVHNFFILSVSEYGIIFTTILLTIFVYCMRQSYRHSFLFFVSLLQMLLLGSFDHYLLTQLQSYLLLILTLSFSVTYNQLDNA